MDVFLKNQYPSGPASLSVSAEEWIKLLPVLTRFTAQMGRGIQQFGETELSVDELEELDRAIKERGDGIPLAQKLKQTVDTARQNSQQLVFFGK